MALVAFLGGFGGALMGGAIVNAFQGDYLAAAVGGGIGLVVLATVLTIINWGA